MLYSRDEYIMKLTTICCYIYFLPSVYIKCYKWFMRDYFKFDETFFSKNESFIFYCHLTAKLRT